MCKHNEITEAEKKQMRPIGLLKIHKAFANIPKFCPNIDTASTPYYKTG